MTIEQYNQASLLLRDINSIKYKLAQLNEMDTDVVRNTVRTRVRGMEFNIPKTAFRSEVRKQKTTLENELSALEAQFDAL